MGELVEPALHDAVLRFPRAPYIKTLLAAVPRDCAAAGGTGSGPSYAQDSSSRFSMR
jgi:ABC-type dipeptide/oligopeptide/nickel transport system ATPase component